MIAAVIDVMIASGTRRNDAGGRHGAPCGNSAPPRPQPTPARESARSRLFEVSRPVLAQDLREVHLASQHVVEQALLDFSSTAFADLRDMQINQCRSQMTVPKIGAHLPDGHPFFEQMGGEAMP